MSLIAELNKFPLSCIYIFIDHKSKHFQMVYSFEGAINSLASNLTDLRRGVFNTTLQDSYNRGDLEIEVLKEYPTPPLRAIICAEYDALCAQYKTQGYTDTRNFIGSNYKLMKRILSDYRGPTRPPLVYITAKSRNKGDLVLAVFETVPKADLWIAETYGDVKDHIVPKFKDDELTLGYHHKHGYKLIMGRTRVKGNLKKRFNGITL
jgi:hypothetical protein